MRRFRPLAALFAAAFLALALGACSDDDETAANELGLIEEGVLTVGSNIAYAPFESYESGETPVGFDIDLLTAIAEEMDLEVRFVNNPSFDDLIPSLQDGRYDAAVSAMTITEEREEQVSFSDPYFQADQSLTVNPEETPEIESADDLTSDHVIGVEKGTTGADYAKEHYGDVVKAIRTFDDTQGSLGDLRSGRIDAVINDFPVSAFAAQKDPETLKVVDRFSTGENYGIAVAQERTDLLEAINTALEALREDGTYDEIFEEWFGEAPA